MRPAKIFSLLLSLGQLLLFLKLIEYVRGDEIQTLAEVTLRTSPDNSSEKAIRVINRNNATGERHSRYINVAPKQKKQKYRPWIPIQQTTENPNDEDYSNEGFGNSSTETNSSEIPSQTGNLTKKLARIDLKVGNKMESTGRLCPGCVSGNCGGTAGSKYVFPVIPVFISFVVGVIWFFIFLFVYYYISEPQAPSNTGSYASSSGGYGKSSWGSWLDFLTGQQRSLEGFNQLTHTVIESLYKLKSIYNYP